MDRPVAPPADDHVAYLRAQYYGCVGGFNWPALESITDANRNHIRPDPSLLLPAKKIIYATLRFIASMSQLMDHRTPNLWTIAQTYIEVSTLTLVSVQAVFFWSWRRAARRRQTWCPRSASNMFNLLCIRCKIWPPTVRVSKLHSARFTKNIKIC
jgi:hypothetical protein